MLAHKLCGAGNGGFFLTFAQKNELTLPKNAVKINVVTEGVWVNPFKEYIEVLECAHMGNEFEKFQEAFKNHSRIIILGNGGSSSVASHISQDYMKFRGKKVSILSDPSMLTMLTNDFKYENAYQKFLEYYVEKETLVVLMSSVENLRIS